MQTSVASGDTSQAGPTHAEYPSAPPSLAPPPPLAPPPCRPRPRTRHHRRHHHHPSLTKNKSCPNLAFQLERIRFWDTGLTDVLEMAVDSAKAEKT